MQGLKAAEPPQVSHQPRAVSDAAGFGVLTAPARPSGREHLTPKPFIRQLTVLRPFIFGLRLLSEAGGLRGRPTDKASQRAQIVRHFAELPDHRRVTEVAGRWISRPAESDRADVAGSSLLSEVPLEGSARMDDDRAARFGEGGLFCICEWPISASGAPWTLGMNRRQGRRNVGTCRPRPS